MQFQNRIGHGGQIGQVERFDHALMKIARRQHLDLAGNVSFIQDALLNRQIRLCPVERCFQAFDQHMGLGSVDGLDQRNDPERNHQRCGGRGNYPPAPTQNPADDIPHRDRGHGSSFRRNTVCHASDGHPNL